MKRLLFIVWFTLGCGAVPLDQPETELEPEDAALIVNAHPMTTARTQFTLTTLPDGKVLAAGGVDQHGTRLSSCEVYDPATEQWSATGSLSNARSAHAATVLADGTVVITGGSRVTSEPNVERYDPSTGTWSLGPSMLTEAPAAAHVLMTSHSSDAPVALISSSMINTSSPANNLIIDRTRPVISIGAPTSQATVSGAVTLTATATDNLGVSHVRFEVNGTTLTVDDSAPYTTTWTPTVAGPAVITMRVYDLAGNTASASVTVQAATQQPRSDRATYDLSLRVPSCRATTVSSCDSGDLLNGRAGGGPEANAPNTINDSCPDDTLEQYHHDESLDRLKISTLDGSPLHAGALVRVDATVWAFSSSHNRLDLFRAPDAAHPTWTLVASLRATAQGLNTMSTTMVLPEGDLQAIRGQFRYGGGEVTPCMSTGYNDHDDLVFSVEP